MSSKRDPKIWIGDILDSIQEIEDTVSNVEVVNFCENHVLINAVSYALLKITEATKHCSLPFVSPLVVEPRGSNRGHHGRPTAALTEPC